MTNLYFCFNIRIDRISGHAQIITHDGLGPIVDQRGSQQGQVALMMVGEMLVEEFRGDKL